MFLANMAVISFTSENMMVLLYRIGMGISRWRVLSICDVCYMLFIGGNVGGSEICAILVCAAQVCLLAAVLCGSTVTVIPYPMSIVGGHLL